MGKFKRICQAVVKCFYVLCGYLLIPFYWNKYKDAWLIAERKDEIQDNGMYLYQYIRDNHPEVTVYYVIDSSSSRIGLVNPENLLIFGSFEHYSACLIAKVLIGAFSQVALPDFKQFIKLVLRKNWFVRGKKVFLNHGVMRFGSLGVYQQNQYDLVVTVCEQEKQLAERLFKRCNAVAVGYPRFDGLVDDSSFCHEDIVMVMPTWRKWFNYAHEPFLDSEFYVQWKSFLKKLADECEKRNLKVYFYSHFELEPYISDLCDSRIKVVNNDTYLCEKLMKNSKILITDFSSVAYDFAYMYKPEVLFQFDSERFFKDHYPKDWFDDETMGSGKVCQTIDAALAEFIKICESGFATDSMYKDRFDNICKYHDNQNSKRVFDEICRLFN